MIRWLACMMCVFSSWMPTQSSAHPLAPSVLTIRSHGDGLVEMTWRAPSIRPKGKALTPRVPDGCTERAPSTQTRQPDAKAIVTRWMLRCSPVDLGGLQLHVDGLTDNTVNVVVRVQRPRVPIQHAVLDAAQPTYQIPAKSSWMSSFLAYLRSGVMHLLEGYDHLVFVLGLVVLFGVRKELLYAVTAFTVGHSITLAAAMLNVVRVRQDLVEVLIAGTIVLLGVEMLNGQGLVSRRPWTLPMALGLLHGLGFASALRGVGIPQDEIPRALLGFNLGIEIGQLGVVAIAAVLLYAFRNRADSTASLGRTVSAYAVGSLGAYWVLARLTQWLGVLS